MTWEPKVRIATRNGVREYVCQGEGLPRQLVHENKNLVQLLGIAWISLLSDSPFDGQKPAATYNKFHKEFERDALGLVRRMAGLAQQLVRSFTIDETANTIDIVFLPEMRRTPIFREYLHFFRTRDPIVLRFIYSFLVYGSKLKLVDPELESDALREWLLVEERLKDLTFDDTIVAPLREILETLFDCWSEADFLPVHGSGAVAERGVRSIQEKNVSFGLPAKVARTYSRADDNLLPSEWAVRGLSECVSRLKFVPKSYKSMRSICMEPVALQWAQQGVRLWMEDVISEALEGFVNLRDQNLNKSAAEFGSMTQLVDTIDLSSASDCVAWDLVKRVFPTRVLKHLLATRSPYAELPSREAFKLSKFSPMGSSLCFPTQTVLYSAIVILATANVHSDSLEHRDDIIDRLWTDGLESLFSRNLSTAARKFQPFRCFGDDIICDKRVTSSTIDLLQQLGFKVNVEKSFVGQSAFRESCGGHYFVGFNVTPIYFRIPSFRRTMSIECLESAIDAANYAYEYGYLKLRSVLVNFCLHYPIAGNRSKAAKNAVLFSNDPNDSMAIFCARPRNSHLRRREAMSEGSALTLQRAEIESLGIKSRSDDEVIVFDNYHYTAWCRSRRHASEEEAEGPRRVRTGTVSTVLCRRWTPAQ